MGFWNVLRIIAMIIFGFLFLCSIAFFATTYFMSTSALSENTADVISGAFVNAIPSMMSQGGLGLEDLGGSLNESALAALKPILKRNISLVFDYITGDEEHINFGLTKDELKELIKNLSIEGAPEGFDMSSIPDSAYDEMLNSINSGFVKEGAQYESQLQPIKEAYGYAKTLFYLSLIVLILLIGLTILINFCLYKSLFWLALFFVINPALLIIASLIGYFSMSSIMAQMMGSLGDMSSAFTDFLSWLAFKYILIYIVFLVIGILLLVGFIIWKIKRKKEEQIN
jgi:hypothetical protein